MRNRAVLIGWMALVLAITVPWTSFQPHAHWDRVAWVPFDSGTVTPVDLAANVALYAPLGWWWARMERARHARRLAYATLTALLLAGACEWTQVYSHGRFPSATDVASNTVGSALGAVVTLWGTRRAAATAPC